MFASRSPARSGALGAIAACALALSGCAADGSGFISDNPFGAGPNYGGSDADSGGGGAGGASAGNGDDASRAITEADIIQIEGPRLYALSRYGGLSIIDISAPDHLSILGRYTASGIPFEMYLRDGTVYAMFSGWGHYDCDPQGYDCTYTSTSHVEAIDVTNAAHPQKRGSFDLPGDISDSRIVGDILYTVTYEDGYCWHCGSNPNTTVTSLNVANPAQIGVVDHLTYSVPDPYSYGWWRRSVMVNEDRMYVGGVDWSGSGEGHSTIQVIDISDPAGHLVQGASVQARGQIESRWQMDEKDGVLRVVSQPGTWWADDVPTVQTFQVISADEITPIAELPLVLPQPERLRSVRFDGDRAYAITAQQMDPLFTLDLHDPAHPVQAGQLEMPGWVYFMEPRGDRLYALGYEQNNPEGSLAVSLFDVADLANPTMISRVHFGGEWSNLPEDQDRIHKSFKIDDQNGAIFVPYSAWNYGDFTDGYYDCGTYTSGIQIVDFTADSLTLRGAAKSRGEARRAFVNGGRLFGVSDAAVTTFDISDRDAPAQKSEIALSTDVSQVVVAGDKVVRLASDWWTGAARLDVVPASDPSRTTPIGSIDLAALDSAQAGNWCWGWSYWGANVFAQGDMVYLVRQGYDGGYYDGTSYSQPQAEVVAVDISTPSAPAVRGRLSFSRPLSYRWYGGVIAGGEDVVQVGTRLVFRSIQSTGYDTTSIEAATLEIIDMADPDHPARRTLALPSGYGHTGLIPLGTKVRLSHWAPLAGDASKVRFFLDEVDVAVATPVLTSINVPGSLLSWDGPSGRALTVDYARETLTGVTYQTCATVFGGNASFDFDEGNIYDYEHATGTCSALHRTLNLVDVEGGVASVADDLPLNDNVYLDSPKLGDDRVFFSTGYSYGYYDDVGSSGTYGPRQLIIGGLREGSLRVVEQAMDPNDWSYTAAVAGKKLVMTTYDPPGVAVLDATNLDVVTYARKADLTGYAYDVTMMGDTALCSMGPWGLQAVDISH